MCRFIIVLTNHKTKPKNAIQGEIDLNICNTSLFHSISTIHLYIQIQIHSSLFHFCSTIAINIKTITVYIFTKLSGNCLLNETNFIICKSNWNTNLAGVRTCKTTLVFVIALASPYPATFQIYNSCGYNENSPLYLLTMIGKRNRAIGKPRVIPLRSVYR